MIRLLQVFHTINPTETSLALGLAACPDIELSVMCAMQCKNHLRLLEAGIPVHPVRFRSKLDVPAVGRLRSELAGGGYDVVHAFTSRTIAGSLLASSWMKPRPAIVAYRGIMDRIRRHDPVSWMTYMHPRLAGVSCISDSCRRGLESSGIDRPLLRTIHLGYKPSPSEPQGFAQYGVPEDAMVAAFVGNIRPVKGIDVLLEAVRRLEDLPQLHFLLIGEVRDGRIAAAAAASDVKDRVHLAGPIPDAQRMLAGASLFVMPSRKEGLCKSVMEAMARGVCPVVSDAGGLPELVRHEQDGLVVPPGDPRQLAAAIRRVAADQPLRRRLAESARRRILEEFSTEKMIRRTRQLYLDVLAGERAASRPAEAA